MRSPKPASCLFTAASGLGVILLASCLCAGQTESATISGRVTDSSGAVIAKATVDLQSADKGTTVQTTTNDAGIYVFPSVHPGVYHITVSKDGFKTEDYVGVTANVQDHLEQNFRLVPGATSESITVTADQLNVNTTDASVSTVVDRHFAENLPMNGRSFQTLIELTPGVVQTVSTPGSEGQFSVNGQRASANYWTVDGVSANIGVSSTNGIQGNGAGGALPGFSAQGGTNSLVSVDAMQEFRIQTSTYAPEFGRVPGGQISIVTRSGTNQFHGTAFDFLRNDLFDANDWFADFNKLHKPEERQNDFGGTLSGPILKDRTFFFFSYEGLRLRLPQVQQAAVPNLTTRQSAVPAMQPVVSAFPLPNGADQGNGVALFNASFSNSSTLDATSLRIDHKITDKLIVFGRYNYSPSSLIQRVFSLANVQSSKIQTQTATLGATWAFSPFSANEIRVNYSRNDTEARYTLDNLGGAKPLAESTIPFPPPFTSQNSTLTYFVFSAGEFLSVGKIAHNLQRQVSLVDSLSLQRGVHSLKFGVDYRHLSPFADSPLYMQGDFFQDNSGLASGTIQSGSLTASNNTAFILRNLGVFGQDTWRVRSRLTLTYGLRWDVDFVPTVSKGPNFAAVTSFNNLSKLALAPVGTPLFHTRFGDLAPRIGVAYQLASRQGWESVLRGGFGVFFDLATQELGSSLNSAFYPFGASSSFFDVQYPLSPSAAAPPPITEAQLSSGGFSAFDPKLNLPYTLQWNVAFEQALDSKQLLTASYIGAVGRRLITTEQISSPNPSFLFAQFIRNGGSSDYDALQLQFQRRLSGGLQALASYTWAHSIDTASIGSFSTFVRQFPSNIDRGPSDFDIRQTFSTAITYDIPLRPRNAVLNASLRGWSVQNIVQARSAPPVNVTSAVFVPNFAGLARPDVVVGVPIYLHGSQCVSELGPPCAGGTGFNPAAFTNPPVDPNTGLALRQGDLGRNALRGFGLWQWDFAVHRDFAIHDQLVLQFRSELFNVLNHPNFGPPNPNIGFPNFGQSTQMLGQSLSNQNLGGGGFSPLYQIAGPRSIQFALKLTF